MFSSSAITNVFRIRINAVGGLIFASLGSVTIEDSFSYAKIRIVRGRVGDSEFLSAGGLIGTCGQLSRFDSCIIRSSFANVSIIDQRSGREDTTREGGAIGGLLGTIGRGNISITNSYARGEIVIQGDTEINNVDTVGGLLGGRASKIQDRLIGNAPSLITNSGADVNIVGREARKFTAYGLGPVKRNY